MKRLNRIQTRTVTSECQLKNYSIISTIVKLQWVIEQTHPSLKNKTLKNYASFPEGIPSRGHHYPRFVTYYFHELI